MQNVKCVKVTRPRDSEPHSTDSPVFTGIAITPTNIQANETLMSSIMAPVGWNRPNSRPCSALGGRKSGRGSACFSEKGLRPDSARAATIGIKSALDDEFFDMFDQKFHS